MSDGKEERFSVRLVEYVDGTTGCEIAGNPTLSQVVGIIEIWRACQRLVAINGYTAANPERRKRARKRKEQHQ